MDYTIASQIDIYLGAGLETQNGDPSSEDLALKSPHFVLSPAHQGSWENRITDISGYDGVFDDVQPTVTEGSYAQLAIPGGVYHLKVRNTLVVPTQINYAKIEILSISGEAGLREITFRYAYQPAPGIEQF